MKTSTTLLLSATLIAGGGLVWWNTARLAPAATNQNLPASTPAGISTNSAHSVNPTHELSQLSDPTLPWQDRVALCEKLLDAKSLTSSEVDALFSMLRDSRIASSNGQGESWFVVANEIMELMRERGIGADRYSSELTALLNDPAQHFVIRDYAIQHLSMWIFPPTADTHGEADPHRKEKALHAIAAAAIDPTISHTSIPGTALMALADITERQPVGALDSTWSRLAPELETWFSPATSVSIPNRVSALQAISRAGVQNLHPMVRSIAEDSSADPSIRLSAVAALGFYGDPDDQSLLIQIAQSTPDLRHAVQSALTRITTK